MPSTSPDELHEIEDYSSATLRRQIVRLQTSNTPEQLIYRECELDELWRLLDLEIARMKSISSASNPDLRRLESMRDAVMESHDLVGESDAARAAARLHEIIS